MIKHKGFALPNREALLKSEMQCDVVLIDATEILIERPEKTKTVLFKQEGEAQMLVDKRSQQIICPAFCSGRKLSGFGSLYSS